MPLKRMVPVLAAAVLAVTTMTAAPAAAIVGGQTAAAGQFPYQVSLWAGGNFQCGASLVDTDLVLTAAHCVAQFHGDASGLRIRHGSTSLGGGTPVAVEKYVAHSQFNPSTYFADVAMLKLASPVAFDANTRPVKLAPANYVVTVAETLTLSGWGMTTFPGPIPDALHSLGMSAIDLKTCASKLATKGPVSTGSFCTTSPSGQGACKGDSGGPLVAPDGTQVGIDSWGVHCALGYPDVFTSVGGFSEWIRATTQQLRT